MSDYQLSIEVASRCISVWKEPWARRRARVTLLVNFGGQFLIVVDTSNGFWFLPGGGMEQNESVEEAAKREAVEELGVQIKINGLISTYRVTLISRETREELKIPPFIVVYANFIGGQLKTEYAHNRRILSVKKDKCASLLRDFEIPQKYECMKPYLYVSKETIRKFLRH
jgi:hypothetical protein